MGYRVPNHVYVTPWSRMRQPCRDLHAGDNEEIFGVTPSIERRQQGNDRGFKLRCRSDVRFRSRTPERYRKWSNCTKTKEEAR